MLETRVLNLGCEGTWHLYKLATNWTLVYGHLNSDPRVVISINIWPLLNQWSRLNFKARIYLMVGQEIQYVLPEKSICKVSSLFWIPLKNPFSPRWFYIKEKLCDLSFSWVLHCNFFFLPNTVEQSVVIIFFHDEILNLGISFAIWDLVMTRNKK